MIGSPILDGQHKNHSKNGPHRPDLCSSLIITQRERSPVRFPVGACAWVVGSVPGSERVREATQTPSVFSRLTVIFCWIHHPAIPKAAGRPQWLDLVPVNTLWHTGHHRTGLDGTYAIPTFRLTRARKALNSPKDSHSNAHSQRQRVGKQAVNPAGSDIIQVHWVRRQATDYSLSPSGAEL